MPPSAARSHLPRESDIDEVRAITRRITSIHPTSESGNSRQLSFRQTGFSETQKSNRAWAPFALTDQHMKVCSFLGLYRLSGERALPFETPA